MNGWEHESSDRAKAKALGYDIPPSTPQATGSPIGCMIAQRITSALTGKGIPYEEIARIVYDECLAIAREQRLGDWVEMPNGTTYTQTFNAKTK